MKQLSVKKLPIIISDNNLQELSLQLDQLEKQRIDQLSWPDYPYRPEVEFAIASNADHILLKYFIKEAFIKAANGGINSAVYQDSCVEFFIAFDDNGYYNFECNCIGALLVGFGKGKTERALLNEKLIKKIKRFGTINRVNNEIYWELTLAIPFEIFYFHNIDSLQGKSCRGNFYKCGDLLPQPHFLSWTAIEAPEPNFHLPEFFGDIFFE